MARMDRHLASNQGYVGSNPAGGTNFRILIMNWHLSCTLRVDNTNYLFYVNRHDVESGGHNLQCMFNEIRTKLEEKLKEEPK